MKLQFRQGIARYQTDVLSTPTFLQKSAGTGNFIDLIVSPDPTIIVFAHRTANYVVEEIRTVVNAWGPFTSTNTVYLYWDLNMLTGELTRGTTFLPPMYTGSEPTSPSIDQHWFDTDETVMRVWTGTKWTEKIRVFAAYLSSGSIIRPYQLGSQVGIIGDFEGGNLVLDAYNKPLRQTDGTFVTTVTSLLIVNNAAKKVKFEAEVLSGMAAEPIPKFSLVQIKPGRRFVLARSQEFMSRIAGIITEDLYTNEVGFVTSDGLIRNENWSFPEDSVGRPFFCGTNGEITITPPTSGVLQIAGFIYDIDAVYMDIQQAIILDDITSIISPPVVPPLAPIADFFGAPISGPAPLTVNFTSLTLNSPDVLEWDFTNDGNVDASTTNASYTYAAPGIYDVRLRALNIYGEDEEIKSGFVTVTLAPSTGTFTNLGVLLSGPAQTSRNHTIQIAISVTNDGFLTATNVVRRLVIPDVKGQPLTPSGLPAGTTITRSSGLTLVEFAPIGTLASGLTYGPVLFSLTAPSKSGTIIIDATVESPEADSAVGDNTTSLSIEVLP